MLWWCVGLAVGFGYSSALCSDVKLYILFGMLWVGIACYFAAEYVHKKYTSQVDVDTEEERMNEENKDGKVDGKYNLSYENNEVDLTHKI